MAEKDDRSTKESGFDTSPLEAETASKLDGKLVFDDVVPKPVKKTEIPMVAKVLLVGVLFFLGGIGYFRSSTLKNAQDGTIIQDTSDVPSPENRKPVPDINIVADGGAKNQKLSDFRGKVVLLSFWASWCTPCLVELPTFIDLHEKLAAKGLVVLPVNVDEPDQAANFVSQFWAKRKFPFPTFFDPTKEASEKFEVDGLPSNFVLDRKGRLVAQGMGANDWSSDQSLHLFEALLEEKDN